MHYFLVAICVVASLVGVLEGRPQRIWSPFFSGARNVTATFEDNFDGAANVFDGFFGGFIPRPDERRPGRFPSLRLPPLPDLPQIPRIPSILGSPDNPSKSPDTPPKGADKPPKGADTPPKGGDAPPKGGDAPPKGGDAPPKGGDAPPKGGDAPPKGGDAPPKNTT